MKRALIVTTVSGFVAEFELNNVKILQSLGYEVHYASNFNNPVYGKDNSRLNGTGILCHQVEFTRSPYDLKNINIQKKLRNLMNSINFDLVHCHTPMGAVHARIAAKYTNTEPIIYTVHGFHFYKGAPLINSILYEAMEKWLARYTDVLITINKEDNSSAKKFNFKKNGKVVHIPGVGISVEEYINTCVDRIAKRKELGVSEHESMLLSVGELNDNKNHEAIIKAISEIRLPYKYVICGRGNKKEYLETLARELNVEGNVIFAGYRADITDILKSADIFCFPSKREGLSVSLMEAMASGLPVICSEIRGNVDLIMDGHGGIVVKNNNVKEYSQAILKLIKDHRLKSEMGTYNTKKIKEFDSSVVNELMAGIYSSCMK